MCILLKSGDNSNITRDRNGDFEPKVIRNYENDISGIENQVIGMYSKIMSTRDISSHLKSIYGIDIYHSLIAKITDKVILRTLIYTINSMESCNRLLRKVTKSKSIFPSDDSLHKSLYLATMDISEK